VVGDIGSGLLRRHPLLPAEPDAASWLEAGAALVTASGDKLLGGPQAGLILGRAGLVRRLARHPLARALRAGKTTIAALEATLSGPPVPLEAALSATPGSLTARAGRVAARLAGAGVDARAVPSEAAVGGGGAPGVPLPSAAVSLPAALAVPLRAGAPVRSGAFPAVVGRVEDGRLLLDLKAVRPDDDELLASAVLAAAGPPSAAPGPPAAAGPPPAAQAPPAPHERGYEYPAVAYPSAGT
jgi:L-seryl-tRNA(Ser) seleniumtransferase